MLPFSFTLEPGIPVYEQIVYAAKKAVISGQLSPGDPFPSVRDISKALKINPNTAHKVVAQLVNEGLIEVHPGRGSFVSARVSSSSADRRHLLKNELEQLVVEAKKLGLSLEEVTRAVGQHWSRLDKTPKSQGVADHDSSLPSSGTVKTVS